MFAVCYETNNESTTTSENYTQSYQSQTNESDLDKVITTQEITQAISKLKTGKSPGKDGIISEIVKNCNCLIVPLCNFYNLLFNSSLYPSDWSQCVVVPVPKKGDVNNVNNYRGITLMNVFSKLFQLSLINV
ncbi:hypothetical protein SNE40_003363 [Patella caerulea]|uniref:Reverse transcriptase n=1 Tax=Patella caerulea TaxID=87958 RepID=A0AAN8K7Q3_PATCE